MTSSDTDATQEDATQEDATQEDTEAQELLADAVNSEEERAGETDWQAKAKKWKRLARKHETQSKSNADKAKQFDEFTEKQKTEQQKLTEAKEAAEKRAAELEEEALRSEVASEKGLTAKQARRLRGSTREELEADADELLADFTPAKPAAPDLKQGVRGDPNKSRQLTHDEVTKMSDSEIVAARRKGQFDDLAAGKNKS